LKKRPRIADYRRFFRQTFRRAFLPLGGGGTRIASSSLLLVGSVTGLAFGIGSGQRKKLFLPQIQRPDQKLKNHLQTWETGRR
jgi:hypothetical protein